VICVNRLYSSNRTQIFCSPHGKQYGMETRVNPIYSLKLFSFLWSTIYLCYLIW
jgi:hypothetical protein